MCQTMKFKASANTPPSAFIWCLALRGVWYWYLPCPLDFVFKASISVCFVSTRGTSTSHAILQYSLEESANFPVPCWSSLEHTEEGS